MKLTGQKILMTGGSAGIGLALAQEFARRGNKLILTGRNESKLAKAKESIPDADTIVCDAADVSAIQNLATQMKERHSDLSVLVNNAGTFIEADLSKPADDLERLTQEIDINFSGPVRTTSALIDVLKANKGAVINVSSGLAFVPLPLSPIYCATKAAIHSYSISLRSQLEDYGVEVIELAPPAVKTELLDGYTEDDGFKMLTTDELVKATFKGLEAGKKEIRPGQANQLYFLSRIAPGFINGQLASSSKKIAANR